MASYSAEILSGAGAPTEELSGAKTFSLVNTLTSSAYFTIESSVLYKDLVDQAGRLKDLCTALSIDLQSLPQQYLDT